MPEILEGRWRCRTCNAENFGRNVVCASCNNQKGDDVEDYLPEDAQPVVDPELLGRANAGVHWTCANCDRQNAASGDHCAFCLAPRGQAEDARRTQRRKDFVESQRREQQEFLEEPWRAEQKRRDRQGMLVAAGATLAIAGVIALVVWALSPRLVPVVVQHLTWTQTIDVKSVQIVAKQGWIGTVPADATDRQCAMRLREAGGRRILKAAGHCKSGGASPSSGGARSMGNGFFSRPSAPASSPSRSGGFTGSRASSPTSSPRSGASGSSRGDTYESHDTTVIIEAPPQPVYESWCAYRHAELVVVRSLVKMGRDAEPPVWPGEDEVKLQPGESKEAHAKYAVTLMNPERAGEVWDYPVDSPAVLQTFKLGERYVLRVSIAGAVSLEGK